jgi:hypothetical protein
MKNFLAWGVVALAGLLGFPALPARAANDSGSVTVTINLTSKCVFGTIAPVVFTYTSFQAALASATGGTFNMKCTNSMPYKIGFTNTATPAATEATTDNALNLAYVLGLSATTGTGSGIDQPYAVTGTMALGQGGTCLTASCTNTSATNKVRTVYVVY